MKRKNGRILGVLAAAAMGLSITAAAVTSASADTSATSHNPHVVMVSTHSVDVGWRGVGASVKDEIIVYNASTNALVKHTTQEAGHSTGRTVDFGTGFEGQALDLKVAFVINGHNTGWSAPVLFYVAASGGLPGPAGPQGPSGLTSSTTQQLVGSNELIGTGGSFGSNKTLVGHITLPAGTYMVSISAKVAWAAGNGVFPQFFVYNGAALADFSNDLFNIGSGGLPQGNATIDSYYTGVGQVTFAADTDVDFYAFGYDTDQGAGKFTLESFTVTANGLQVSAS